MAQVKFLSGQKANLDTLKESSRLIEGALYFCEDTQRLYRAMSNNNYVAVDEQFIASTEEPTDSNTVAEKIYLYNSNLYAKIDGKVKLLSSSDAVHKPQVYNVVADGTTIADSADIDAAVASLTDKKFGNGDIIVIKEANGIAAAYQYDDDNDIKWEALAGKVNAANVMFKQDFTLAGNYTSIGNVTKRNNNATSTLEANNKSVLEVFMSIFTKTLQPGTPTQPAVSLTFSQAGSYEVGTKVTPKFSATLSAGSYTYGPATGITAQSWSITDTEGNSATTASGSFPEIQVIDNINYKITATATHNEGTIAKNNIGGDSNPQVKINAGSKTKTSGAVTGYRNMFFGSSTTVQELNSAIIRGYGNKRASGAVTDHEVAIVEGAKQVVIAVPEGRTLSAVKDVGAFGTDIVASFVRQAEAVEGANGYTAKNYNVYVYKPDAALGANTYKVTIK